MLKIFLKIITFVALILFFAKIVNFNICLLKNTGIMTRETLIVLIEKEINELQTLTKGFSEMPEFPKSLLDLAVAKADNLRECLLKLPEATQPVASAVIEKVVESAPVMEPVQEIQQTETTVDTFSVVETSVETQDSEISEVVTEQVSQVTSVVTEHATPHIVGETIQKAATVSDSLSKSDESLGSTIAKQPINDIKQAISIADRFRFQRELFGGNGEKMNQVLGELNELDTLEKAQAYIAKHFMWAVDNENVADFMMLLQRRYSN